LKGGNKIQYIDRNNLKTEIKRWDGTMNGTMKYH